MNPFTDTFLNFEDTSLDFDKHKDNLFSLSTPNSDSTAFQNPSSSPNQYSYFVAHEQTHVEYNTYSDDFMSPHDYQLKASNFFLETKLINPFKQIPKTLTTSMQAPNHSLAITRTKES